MIVEYLPPNKIVIDSASFTFSEDRNLIRVKINAEFKEDNQVFELPDFARLPGIDFKPIHQRRDVYKNIHSSDNYFFLNYDSNDLLNQVEIHRCDKIKVLDVLFGFEEDVKSVALKLGKYDSVVKKDDGEYFFKDLKISIISHKKMGGKGNTLGYFYCASDISHLE